MQFREHDYHSRTDVTITDYPALAGLDLGDTDLQELSQQGFVRAEQRGAGKYFKLRFRRAGQQVVRYIGDAERARAVERDLAALQNTTHIKRRLRETTRLAKRQLRDAKRVLAPLLAANGLAFHGLAIRRPRQANKETSK